MIPELLGAGVSDDEPLVPGVPIVLLLEGCKTELLVLAPDLIPVEAVPAPIVDEGVRLGEVTSEVEVAAPVPFTGAVPVVELLVAVAPEDGALALVAAAPPLAPNRPFVEVSGCATRFVEGSGSAVRCSVRTLCNGVRDSSEAHPTRRKNPQPIPRIAFILERSFSSDRNQWGLDLTPPLNQHAEPLAKVLGVCERMELAGGTGSPVTG